ncbi:hypothetical protein OIU84_026761 [Salix udensis]|uniref:Uncharacterized protein n=1 Tax=Salix udensis TaxID=889485 RepID=A0AAD6KNR9_9ROSI|nr:hypothetical protein OIU84_026761 [Salix udensis]
MFCSVHLQRRKVFIHNGGERQFQAPTEVKKITSGHYRVYMLVHSALSYAPLPPTTRLEPGEVYYLMPPDDQPFTLEVPLKLTRQGACARRKMKIVVTIQQLGLILRNSKQFNLKGIAAEFSESFKVGDRKWQPSLVPFLKCRSLKRLGFSNFSFTGCVIESIVVSKPGKDKQI